MGGGLLEGGVYWREGFTGGGRGLLEGGGYWREGFTGGRVLLEGGGFTGGMGLLHASQCIVNE